MEKRQPHDLVSFLNKCPKVRQADNHFLRSGVAAHSNIYVTIEAAPGSIQVANVDGLKAIQETAKAARKIKPKRWTLTHNALMATTTVVSGYKLNTILPAHQINSRQYGVLVKGMLYYQL